VDEQPLHLSVDLDRGTNPIAGAVAKAGGAAQRFEGYMDLISTLEALRLAGSATPVRDANEGFARD
jgi:hypothetical protein